MPAFWLSLRAFAIGVTLAVIRDMFLHLLGRDMMQPPDVLLELLLRGVLDI